MKSFSVYLATLLGQQKQATLVRLLEKIFRLAKTAQFAHLKDNCHSRLVIVIIVLVSVNTLQTQRNSQIQPPTLLAVLRVSGLCAQTPTGDLA